MVAPSQRRMQSMQIWTLLLPILVAARLIATISYVRAGLLILCSGELLLQGTEALGGTPSLSSDGRVASTRQRCLKEVRERVEQLVVLPRTH